MHDLYDFALFVDQGYLPGDDDFADEAEDAA
jgi:hypothetical protein